MSAQQWLSWKCGVGLTAVSERLRVAHALEELPVTAAAFGAGELSWSKVRAITRVATGSSDAVWADLGRASTAAQLERLARARRRLGAADDVSQLAARGMSACTRGDGSVELRVVMTGEEAAMVLAVLDAWSPPVKGVPRSVRRLDSLLDVVLTEPEAATDVPDVVPASQEATIEGAGATRPRMRRRSRVTPKVVVHVGPDGAAHTDRGLPIPASTVAALVCSVQVDVTGVAADGQVWQRVAKRSPNRSMRRWLEHHHPGCQFPGCHHDLGVDVHHVHAWTDGGPTALDNLVRVCRFHHRLVHAHDLRVHLAADRTLTVTTRSGRLIDRPIPDLAFDVPRPAEPNAIGQWHGDRMDVDLCLVVVEQAETHTRCHRHHDTFPAGNRVNNAGVDAT